jgi:hypothetical protein
MAANFAKLPGVAAPAGAIPVSSRAIALQCSDMSGVEGEAEVRDARSNRREC